MIVAITGASGHVGANLVRRLLADGHTCRVLVRRDERALAGLNIERFAGDVLDPSSLAAAFSGAERVFHLAALISVVGDPDGAVARTNVVGPRNVVAACRQAGVRRLVHFSSIHAYSQSPLDQILDETRPHVDAARAYAYDGSKAAGEREVLAGVAQGLDAVIVNPTAVLGPQDFKPSRMGQILLDLYHRRLPALVHGGFDWVDARDVADGAWRAAERGRTGEKYLLGGHWASVRELATLAQDVTGVPAPRFDTPMPLARLAAPFAFAFSRWTGRTALFTPESLGALRANRRISHDKATRELGYAPRPLAETVRDAYAWFRAAGLLEAK